MDMSCNEFTDRGTFHMQVCSQPCTIDEPFCQPLAQLILGIKPSLMNDSDAVNAVVSLPPASINTECTNTGRGLLWEHAALGHLGTQSPASGQRCNSFSLTLSSSLSYQLAAGRSLTLADICQQDVLVFDGTTGQRQPQSYNSTGICMWVLLPCQSMFRACLMSHCSFEHADPASKSFL